MQTFSNRAKFKAEFFAHFGIIVIVSVLYRPHYTFSNGGFIMGYHAPQGIAKITINSNVYFLRDKKLNK